MGVLSRLDHDRNYSPWVSVLNLCNVAIGAGVLSFPFAFRQTGVFGGLFLSGLIWAVEVGALCLLIRTAERCNSKSYQDLVVSTLGAKMAVVTSATMLVFMVGSMISYLIITGDVFQPVFAGWFGEDSVLADRRLVIALFAILVVLPLSLKTRLRGLKWTSTISVIMLTYLTVSLATIGIVRLVNEGFPQHANYFSGGLHAFIAMDVVVFAFHCHIQVIHIFAELADQPSPFIGVDHQALEKEPILPVREDLLNGKSPSKRRSCKVKRMDGVIFISMTICFVGYCLVGEFGYLLFPDVESDILKSFGNSNRFMNFARMGMAVVAMVCYPVNCFPARSILDDAIKHAVYEGTVQSFSWTRHVLSTLFLFGLSLGTALLITDLGAVFSIMGSTGGVLAIFVIPGLLLMYMDASQENQISLLGNQSQPSQDKIVNARWARQLGGCLLIGIGALIFFTTAYVTVEGL